MNAGQLKRKLHWLQIAGWVSIVLFFLTGCTEFLFFLGPMSVDKIIPNLVALLLATLAMLLTTRHFFSLQSLLDHYVDLHRETLKTPENVFAAINKRSDVFVFWKDILSVVEKLLSCWPPPYEVEYLVRKDFSDFGGLDACVHEGLLELAPRRGLVFQWTEQVWQWVYEDNPPMPNEWEPQAPLICGDSGAMMKSGTIPVTK